MSTLFLKSLMMFRQCINAWLVIWQNANIYNVQDIVGTYLSVVISFWDNIQPCTTMCNYHFQISIHIKHKCRWEFIKWPTRFGLHKMKCNNTIKNIGTISELRVKQSYCTKSITLKHQLHTILHISIKVNRFLCKISHFMTNHNMML